MPDPGFLSPLGALVAVAVVLPIWAIRMRERRAAPLRSALGLDPPGRGAGRGATTALVVAFALLGLAAAQPVVSVVAGARARTDAEAYVVFDTSRSMSAAAAAGAPTRLERAVGAGLRIRSSLPEIPVGVVSMTDRALPHLFPTADASAFAAVATRAIGIERPPPRERQARATTFAVLERLDRENFFGGGAARRLVVLLTDGESRVFDPEAVSRSFERSGIGLVIVRFWDARERVFASDGSADPAYRPDATVDAQLGRLAAATSGGRVFAEDEVGSAVRAARTWLGTGPLVASGPALRVTPLAPWLVLAAAVPLALLLLGGLRRRVSAPESRAQPAAPRARTGFPRNAWRATSRTSSADGAAAARRGTARA